jgi:hypothetical protein
LDKNLDLDLVNQILDPCKSPQKALLSFNLGLVNFPSSKFGIMEVVQLFSQIYT